MKKRSFIFSILFIVGLIMISSLLLINMYQESREEIVYEVSKHQDKEVSLSGKEWTTNLTLGAIGDILIHDWVYEDAHTASGYNFKPMFQHVKNSLQSPDLLLANQETVLGGVEMGLSSYPTFNSPKEVGDALIDAGVDIVSTANNHSLDKGEKGVLSSIDYYEKVRMPYVGFFKDKEDQNTLRIIEKNGVKLAFLAYSYGTNGIPVPEGKEYLVNLIDKNKMKEEIHKAKEVADVVVMSIHWGNEYQRFPTNEQKELGQYLADEGADIIFGHHPHVLQPMDMLKTKDDRNTFIVYSLGNFLSGQMWDYKDIGGLATIDITKHVNANGTKIELSNPTFLPTFVSNKRLKEYRIVPLKNASPYGLKNAVKQNEEIMLHMTEWLK
ncbi:CapA family protein [Bacillus sp. CGMCC 1.16607]|uniref:CapA family protein n=1 Tax=Bacillus sp. CGMCC 1.16607 TaxID=3351842 RepID=UPI003627056F